MDLYEKTLEEELIYQGDYLTFVKQKVLLPDGNTASRDMLKHPGAVGIVAFLEDDKIVLVEQFRKPVEKTLIEIPAGKIDRNEDPLKSAIRELEEETGYIPQNIEYLGKIAPAPGFCDEYIYLYKATNLKKGIIGGDEDEFINVITLSISEIKVMIRSGKIEDAKTIAAMAYL